MRKDLQKRLLAVAAILDRTTAQVKLADGENRDNFWKKFFYKEPKVAPQDVVPDQAQPFPEPKTMVAPEAPRTKEEPAYPQRMPKPQVDPVAPVEDIAHFLQGGPVPLAVINPLAQLAKGLAGAGAIGEKDIKSVVAFMAKMLRKYVGGQKLAAARQARLERIASREAEAIAAKIDIQKFLESHPEEQRHAAAGLLRDLVIRNGLDWKSFHQANAEQLTAFITEEGALTNEAPKQASFRDQIAAVLQAKK